MLIENNVGFGQPIKTINSGFGEQIFQRTFLAFQVLAPTCLS
jgi:hypothetical protein